MDNPKIPDYKKKFFTILSIIILWAIIMFGAELFTQSTVTYTISVNSHISLTYPSSITVSDIYTKYSDASPYIEASNSDYKSFVDFKSSIEGFEFSYPSIFKIDEQKFPGSEILYHIDFQNKKDQSYTGFLQVWELPYSLENFLQGSLEGANTEFQEFKQKKITVNGLDGYFWDYTVEGAKEKYKSLEVFLTKGSKLYRISYYIPEKKYTKDDYDMFWKMVNSFKLK